MKRAKIAHKKGKSRDMRERNFSSPENFRQDGLTLKPGKSRQKKDGQ